MSYIKNSRKTLDIMDTHAVINTLHKEYKLPVKTAEAMIFAVQQGQPSSQIATKSDIADMATKDDIANMATKADIAALRKDMATKVDLANMETKIVNMATKADIADMATKADIANMETKIANMATKIANMATQSNISELRSSIEKMENRLLWRIIVICGIFASVSATAIVAALRFMS